MPSDRQPFHVVVPARYGSERLPGKPLAMIGGVPMIVRVAQQVANTRACSVVVATDDERVRAAVVQAGFEAVMTRTDHPSGSDRVMEVADQRGWSDDDIVVNVQGDEPLIPPQVVDALATGLAAHPGFGVATLAEPLVGVAPEDPNVVKVVRAANGRALYFSRAPIPFPRSGEPVARFRHVGIYAYRVGTLRTFVGLPAAGLEQIERLEQLRLLENGIDILVLEAGVPVPGGVDTPADLARVNALF